MPTLPSGSSAAGFIVALSFVTTALRALVVLFVLFVVLVFVLRWLGRRSLRAFGTRLFEAKSSVLRDAHFELHHVRSTARPRDPDDGEGPPEDDGEVALSFWEVECTITPTRAGGEMQHWDPWDFSLVPIGTDLRAAAVSTEVGLPEAELWEVSGVDPLVAADDIDKIAGAARLRFTFGCPRDLGSNVTLRYYFERIGDLRLPSET